MAQIMHGRRAGQSKSAPSGPSFNPDNPERYMDEANRAGKGPVLPGGTDLRHVAVLAKDDWARIQYQLHKGKIEEEQARIRREGRADLYQKSKEKVKLWTNTIDGHRKKKLEARKIRLQEEEEQKKKVDIEHKKFVAQLRKEAIEKAKLQQYYQTDRVKNFHSALLLTECLKERDAQIELKKLQEKAQEGQDRVWIDLQQKNLEEAILADQDEARKRFEKNKDAQRFQVAQINNHLKQADRRRMEAQVEGEELEKLAIQFTKEKQRLAEIQAVEAKQLLADNLKQRNDVKRMSELMKAQEDEEDEECRMFAAAKTKMMRLRAEKERELHMAQQKRLDAIRGKLTVEMQEKMDDEDERMQKAIREADAKKEAEERGQAEWRRKMRKEIAEHRDKTMQEKEKEKREQRKRELEELIAKREAALVFAKNEEEKMRRRRAEATALSKVHLEQAEERIKKDVAAREQDLAYARKDLEICEAEEKQFQEYAKKVIDCAKDNGRPTHMLKRAAKEGAGGGLGPIFPGKGGVRPSYMTADVSGTQLPCYQRGSTDDVKQTIHGKATSGTRLGFGYKK